MSADFSWPKWRALASASLWSRKRPTNAHCRDRRKSWPRLSERRSPTRGLRSSIRHAHKVRVIKTLMRQQWFFRFLTLERWRFVHLRPYDHILGGWRIALYPSNYFLHE